MQAKDWKKVKPILEEVLNLELSERQRFLDGLEIEPEIKREVETLLTFEDTAENWSPATALDLSKDFFDDEESKNYLIGQRIGFYEISEEIGFGGMGAVYLAERVDEKFKQKVAIKMLRREFNTEKIRKRFRIERDIQAALVHQNIATLLDAGTTDEGIPYLIMEYVEGVRIDKFCDENNLNLNERLKLFNKVCEAVAFAHRNLIIHRDIKPSNIIVTKNSEPKLLDFGISKLIDGNNFNTNTVTKLGAMTPEYASPEQIKGESVTTATDIYSLGVILFKILTGTMPYNTANKPDAQIFSEITNSQPKIPSKAAIEEEEKRRKREKDRKTSTLKNLSFQIRGDLDNIILKSLRKQPERRYKTVEQFAADIRRFIDGLPVTARRSTFSYRASKFYGRNKIQVLAGFFVLLSLITGISVAVWQASAARAQARIAQAEREKAERRFDDVRNLANSFLFSLTPKIEKLPGSTPAKKELVSLALQYLDSLSSEAGDDLELQRELAAAYEKVGDVQGNQLTSNLGDTEGAADSYEKALTIRQKLYDLQPEDLTAMSDLASSYGKYAEIQRQVGTSDKVAEYYQKSLELREEIIRRNPNDVEARKNLAIAVRGKGTMFYSEAKYKDAIENYNRANDIYKKLLREQPENTEIRESFAYMFIDIGEAQGWNDDLEAAEISLKTGVDLLTALAEKNPNNQNLQRSLMNAYLKKGTSTIETKDYEKAVREYGKAVEIAENSGKVDPQNILTKWDIVKVRKKLAEALALAGSGKESLEILKNALKLAEELTANDAYNSKNYYEIATVRFKMGETFYSIKDYESALKNFEQSNKEYRAVVEMDPKYRFAVRTIHLSTLSIADTYAALAAKRNDKELYKKSLENYRDALDGFQKMKAAGKLGDFDNTLFPEIENAVKKINLKIGN